MAEVQPPRIVEGATTGDIDDEIPVEAKSAEDRKAAAALSSLDAPHQDDAIPAKNVDIDAVKKAMARLAGTGATNGVLTKKTENKVVKKVVKVEISDVNLLMEELDLPKAKATDLLRSYDGDVKTAMEAWVDPAYGSGSVLRN